MSIGEENPESSERTTFTFIIDRGIRLDNYIQGQKDDILGDCYQVSRIRLILETYRTALKLFSDLLIQTTAHRTKWHLQGINKCIIGKE